MPGPPPAGTALPWSAFLPAAGWSYLAFALLTLAGALVQSVVNEWDGTGARAWLLFQGAWLILVGPCLLVAALLALALRPVPGRWHAPVFGLVFFALFAGATSPRGDMPRLHSRRRIAEGLGRRRGIVCL